VVVDHLTKMAVFILTTTSSTAEELAQLYVTHVFSKHGLPNNIVSDRESEFTSSSWKSFTKLLNIESHFSTAFHPETRVNQVLEQHLITYTDYRQSNWCSLLPLAEFAHNSAPHSSTTVSPFFADKGFDPPSHFTPKTIPDSEPTSRKGRVQGPSGDRISQAGLRASSLYDWNRFSGFHTEKEEKTSLKEKPSIEAES
jgi:hypothetical protein